MCSQLARLEAAVSVQRWSRAAESCRVPQSKDFVGACPFHDDDAPSLVRLRERLSSGQALSEHASHVLRTPLTALRMELEDLSLNEDLPEDAVATV
ncbi:MAG: hypothetical protein ACSLEW_05700, partial [Nocardioides sp.]